MKQPGNPPASLELCLIRDDLFFRVQRKLGLVPVHGLGVVRRALFWSMLAWLPLVFWAGATGHVPIIGQDEAVFQHFGIHVRCLVAIPLFIVAEFTLNGATSRLLPYFATSGLIGAADMPRFSALLANMKKLRDSVFPWVVISGLILARSTLPLAAGELHELAWADAAIDSTGAARFGFGGWWFLYITRSVFLVLALAWVWRLGLLFILMTRIARFNLALVPSHPDRLGGLGFLEQMPKAFAPVVFALSAVVAAKWGHEVVYHQQSVLELKTLMISFAVVMVGIFLAPYLAFAGVLRKARLQALLDYGKLVGEHGRLVRRRWIGDEPIGESALLSAPEIGPVADAAAIYEAVQNMRTAPVGKKAIISLAVPVAIPLVILLAVQVPIKDVLLTLLKALA